MSIDTNKIQKYYPYSYKLLIFVFIYPFNFKFLTKSFKGILGN